MHTIMCILYIYIYVRVWLYVCIYICVYIYIIYIHVYIYIYMLYTCIYIYVLYTCMYVCMYVCMYIYMHIHVYIYIYTYVYTNNTIMICLVYLILCNSVPYRNHHCPPPASASDPHLHGEKLRQRRWHAVTQSSAFSFAHVPHRSQQ